jgi:cation:H+ antiporter
VTAVPARFETGWQRRMAGAGSCACLGVLAAVAGGQWPAFISAAILGVGIAAASLMLAWGVDVALGELSGRLVILAAAVVATLPELTVEVHLAFTRQSDLVSANLTGATRLDLAAAVAIPAIGAAVLQARGQPMPPPIAGPGAGRQDLAVLAIAALGALALAATGRLTLLEGLLLGALYVAYVLGGRSAGDQEPAALAGVAAQIAALPRASRRRLSAALFIAGAVSAFTIASAFPDELIRAGLNAGIEPYLLIQTVVPLFTEAPELVMAGTLTLHGRARQGIALLVASSLIQSTLALASISTAYLAGGGGAMLRLAGPGRIELALTAAITLVTVAALGARKPHRVDGWIVVGAFALQAAFTSWPAHLFLALALLIYAIDVLAPPLYAQVRRLRIAARNADRDTHP